LTSDSEGKYSVCGLTPRSHVLKADPITLPRGSRLTTSSNRNLGDAGSLWLDLKRGELHRADFIEGSCSNIVIEQVKARRAQGEVRAPESEKRGAPGLRFDSKAHGKGTLNSPQQGTDSANQRVPKPRTPASAPRGVADDENNLPTPILPINGPPPSGRSSGATDGGSNAGR
jgi:large repetitive protein